MKAARYGLFFLSLTAASLLTAHWAASRDDSTIEAEPVWTDPSAGPALRGEADTRSGRSLTVELFESVGRGLLARNCYVPLDEQRWLPVALAGGTITRFDGSTFEIMPCDARGVPVGPPERFPVSKQRGSRHFPLTADDGQIVVATVETLDLTAPEKDASTEDELYYKRACDLRSLLKKR